MAIFRLDCPHCPATHVAFVVAWATDPDARREGWNCAAECGACGLPVCFRALKTGTTPTKSGTTLSPKEAVGEINGRYVIDAIWPSRTETGAPPHTPTAVARRFIEAEDNYRRRSWNSAVAMYRSALDIGTKGMDGVPAGLTFFKRLEWLHEQNRITPDIRSWADHVRVEGNEALHDPEDFEEADARPLRLFTEMFLRYVFELPGEVALFRQQIETLTPSA